VVVGSRGVEHRKVALTGVVDGRGTPVVWACREDEWQAASNEGRESPRVCRGQPRTCGPLARLPASLRGLRSGLAALLSGHLRRAGLPAFRSPLRRGDRCGSFRRPWACPRRRQWRRLRSAWRAVVRVAWALARAVEHGLIVACATEAFRGGVGRIGPLSEPVP
jgi:hypothetical protein